MLHPITYGLLGAVAAYFVLRPGRFFDPEIVHAGSKADPRAMAPLVREEVVSRAPWRYSRRLLETFQHQVGVSVTGRFDGETHGAVIAMGVPAETLPPPDHGVSVPYFGLEVAP